jgi:hypothetical protein
MDENCLAYGIEISNSDWEKTPASIKQLVEKMRQYIKQSEKRLAYLEAKQQEYKVLKLPLTLPLPIHQHLIHNRNPPLRKLRQQLLDHNLQSRVITPALLQKSQNPDCRPNLLLDLVFPFLQVAYLTKATIALHDHFSGFGIGAAEQVSSL